jgi:hypothetical protein
MNDFVGDESQQIMELVRLVVVPNDNQLENNQLAPL